MDIRPGVHRDLAGVAALAARLQVDPTSAIAYLGAEADGITNELAEIDWRSVSTLAFDGDRMIGWLAGDIDAELGRVYWLGPFVDVVDVDTWKVVASRLYESCSGLMPPEMTQEEMAIDVRFQRCERWAVGHGFTPGTGSSVLVLDTDLVGPALGFRAVCDDDLATLGALHEELFPGTHTTGRQLVEDRDDRHVRLVAEIEGSLAGYVAFEFQPDGAGYLDFLGVAPRFRRCGLAAQLVRAAVAALTERGATPISLTVRVDNVGARALYASLGFTEERVIVPLRKGFAVA